MNHLTLIHEDNFEVDGRIDPKRWAHETLADGLHRAGSYGIDRDGNPAFSAAGKRWAGWYDAFRDELAYVENGSLILKGRCVEDSDPTRHNYSRAGVPQPYADNRLYTSWIQSWGRKYVHGQGVVTDPDSPNIQFNPGVRIEIGVNFDQMCVPGHRVSCWVMPSEEGASKAYDSDPRNGIEIDLFEYDPARPYHLLMKCVGGSAGDTPNGLVDLRGYDIDLTQGDHEIALEWTLEGLIWFVDGVEVQRDMQRAPYVPGYIVLSREMNSGVKPVGQGIEGHDAFEVKPYIPADPGLFGVSVLDNAHLLYKDIAKINHVRVHRINPGLPRTVELAA